MELIELRKSSRSPEISAGFQDFVLQDSLKGLECTLPIENGPQLLTRILSIIALKSHQCEPINSEEVQEAEAEAEAEAEVEAEVKEAKLDLFGKLEWPSHCNS